MAMTCFAPVGLKKKKFRDTETHGAPPTIMSFVMLGLSAFGRALITHCDESYLPLGHWSLEGRAKLSAMAKNHDALYIN